jgi:DNA ligase D-like protein (predicted ligase)
MLPDKFQPMLATIAEPFDSLEYTYEIKWDGYRCLAFLDSDTRLLSRNQKDLTFIFPELQSLHRKINKPGCLLDGEIIALRDNKPSFLELQKRAQLKNVKKINQYQTKIPVVYVAFDILYYNQNPVFQTPLMERRDLLLNNCYPENEFIITNYIENKGIAYFNAICSLKLEGVIAKKKESIYQPGKRVKTWLKFKKKLIQNFIICGYVISNASNRTVRSLVLGAYVDKQLYCFGAVSSGLNDNELSLIRSELTPFQTEVSPFTAAISKQKEIVWLKPMVVCEVEYLELTDEGHLRHPVFKKFRADLQIKDCQYED